MPGIFWSVPAAGVVAIIFAILMARDVLKRSPGTHQMEEIGAMMAGLSQSRGGDENR